MMTFPWILRNLKPLFQVRKKKTKAYTKDNYENSFLKLNPVKTCPLTRSFLNDHHFEGRFLAHLNFTTLRYQFQIEK